NHPSETGGSLETQRQAIIMTEGEFALLNRKNYTLYTISAGPTELVLTKVKATLFLRLLTA
ncbi:MAG: hypothetical protein AABX69_02340, partial [Nanoarchaeota archaeon]